ncbi:trace amine-associated receptor 13c-like isoform X1 [Nerophis lumbriciformis]|uniref:trace amine-associated receptor 13c-like isoform X1 n=1 Tax=Nerophis lumbriciformis TaxID=546530 RepID=UPI002ADEFF56|nr:trace amine-associated receptor 13c-like isoform X1 [Nerophis lumbriciformis]
MMETEDQSELCFPQLSNISCKKPMSHWSGDILLTVLLSVICVFTVFLNLLVIISISHFRQLHTPTKLLLLSLAVSDLLVGLLVIPGEIYMRTSCWALGDVLCSLWSYMVFTVTFASVAHMVLISADRYVAICDPLHYNTRVTVGRVRFCVCLCWFSFFPYCGIILKEQLAHPAMYKSCHGECVIGFEYASGVVDIVVGFVLPLSIILILYMRVFMVAVSQARAMRSHVASIKHHHSVTVRAKKSELKAARTLGVVILVFIMCLCPYFIFTLASDNKIISLLAHYAVYLFDFNSCLNPLIYTLFYPWFRKAARCVVTLRILKSGSRGDNIL